MIVHDIPRPVATSTAIHTPLPETSFASLTDRLHTALVRLVDELVLHDADTAETERLAALVDLERRRHRLARRRRGGGK